MTKKSLILLILILSFGQVFAQPDTLKNQIGIRLGYNTAFLKDALFSSLNYSEAGVLVGTSYIRQNPSGKSIFETNIDVSTGKLNTKSAIYFTGSYIYANIRLAYLRKLYEHKNTSYYLGGQYQTQIQYFDWKSQSAFSFMTTNGLSLNGLVNYSFNSKHSIQSGLSIPVFQVLARPPYNGIDEFISANQDNPLKLILTGKPTSITKYFALKWHTSYVINMSRRFDFRIAYALQYQNVVDINKFIELQNQFTTGLNFKF